MCGIIGYTGKKSVKDVLLNGLELLEYRGYDSAGIALSDPDGIKTEIYKCAGRVADLRKLCEGRKLTQTCGIGHTRWATHGGVCDENAHPHRVGKVTLVHNGIIENYEELAAEYDLLGKLRSQTDSEIAAGVFDHFYEGDPYDCIKKAVGKLKGTFAFVLMFADFPERIYSIRNVSPIVAAKTEDGAILASDVTAIGKYTGQYFVVPEYHVLIMTKDGMTLTDLDGNKKEPEYLEIDFELNMSEKDGFPFYMEKEMAEQPRVIARMLEEKTTEDLPNFSGEQVPDSLLTSCESVCIIACGSAMHAGLAGQFLMKKFLHIPVSVEMASEFMYTDPVVDEKTLVIAVSQSGETIDTLEALKYAKQKGAGSLAVINVKGSSIARESDAVLYTNAGPEIAVASTKAYTSQLALFALLVARMAYVRGNFTETETRDFVRELKRVPDAMEKVLAGKEKIHHIAGRIISAKDIFMIGRGLDYFIAMEGSLKLKEVSYIHSEAYASGELKHGPLALITEHTPVVAVATQKQLLSKEVSNIREVRSRGADVVLFAKEQLMPEEEEGYLTFELPDVRDEFMCLPAAAALQLLAYYVSSDKGYDVDKPRNLAKVVTVE